MAKVPSSKEEPERSLVLGDDAIRKFDEDWFDFRGHVEVLTKQLYEISKSSGVCCGIIGSWGSGKSSFMKLMREYIGKQYSGDACTAWFTAWDPGGLEDLGDAMLYNLFRDVSDKNKELSEAFRNLELALGVRKGIRQRAREAFDVVGKAIPDDSIRGVARITSGLLKELDAPRKVHESFDELIQWLEKKNQTVFFFIDDIDRAEGVQIRDLLSELKIYVASPRIVAVLGYDEEYVLQALRSPVLPEGIDPKRYLEKIVTVRKNIPVPSQEQQVEYAANLLEKFLGTDSVESSRLGSVAVSLSLGNPRKLKTLVLKFASSIPFEEPRKYSHETLASYLVTVFSSDLGLFYDEKIKEAFDEGEEEGIISVLKENAQKNGVGSREITALISVIETLRPDFESGTLEDLGLSPLTPRSPSTYERSSPEAPFNWQASLSPILSNAANHGFSVPKGYVMASANVVVPQSTRLIESSLGGHGAFSKALELRLGPSQIRMVRVFGLTWKAMDLWILTTSDMAHLRGPFGEATGKGTMLVNRIFDMCDLMVVAKSFALWVLDDLDIFSERYIKNRIDSASERSRGLKHPLVFLYTPALKLQALLAFLLETSGVRGHSQRPQGKSRKQREGSTVVKID